MEGSRILGKAGMQSCPCVWHLWVSQGKESTPKLLLELSCALTSPGASQDFSARCLLCLAPSPVIVIFLLHFRRKSQFSFDVLFDVYFMSGEVVMAVPAVGPCLSSGGGFKMLHKTPANGNENSAGLSSEVNCLSCCLVAIRKSGLSGVYFYIKAALGKEQSKSQPQVPPCDL